MNKIKYGSIILVVVFMSLVNSTAAQAQATRTWVSGVGDDANPCSRTAPCKTFAGAISKTAAAGEINVLDPGGFGAVTITKSITIDGGGSLSGVLVSGTNGIIISAASTDKVTLRNLNVNGVNTGLAGIKFLAGGELHVEKVAIFEFTGAGIDFEPNQAANSRLSVDDVYLRDNAGGGILVKPAGGGSALAAINKVEAYGNSFGVRVEDLGTAEVIDSVLAENTNNGLLAFSATQPAVINMVNNDVFGNAIGVAAGAGINSVGPQAIFRLSNNRIFGNGNGLRVASGGSIISFGNNQNTGNTNNGAPTSTIGQQ